MRSPYSHIPITTQIFKNVQGKKPLHHGMLEGSDLINYSFKRRNSLKLCVFYLCIHYLQSYWIYREKYRFSMLNISYWLLFIWNQCNCSSSICETFFSKSFYMRCFARNLNLCLKLMNEFFLLDTCTYCISGPVLLTVFLAGRIQIDSWNYAMIPVSMASKFL